MKAHPRPVSKIIEKYNWLPPEALTTVSEQLALPMTDIYSVATLYQAVSLAPHGKYIVTVCLGTARHAHVAQAVLDRLEERLEVKPGRTTVGGTIALESVNFLGACALAPNVVVDGKYYGQATMQRVDKTTDPYQDKYQHHTTARKRKQ